MDWHSPAIGLALVAMIITAIVQIVRHREKMRAAARNAEFMRVIAPDTGRAFWIASASHTGTSDHDASSGSWYGGDCGIGVSDGGGGGGCGGE
jgi:hypothetical protein